MMTPRPHPAALAAMILLAAPALAVAASDVGRVETPGSQPADLLKDRLASAAEPAGSDAESGDAATSGDEAAAGENGAGDGEEIVFLHALDNKPIEFDLRPDQEITTAVDEFHETAENPYKGDEEAIAAGKKLYNKLCKACHLEDGTGRIGPNLVDDTWKYERTGTDKGNFEIIYAGGAGAMQAFGRRIDQDEILKVMAYLDVLGEE